MEKTTINLIKLTASKGMVLTNGEAYGEEIYLGCNDSEDNWHEITEAKYENILAEEKARMKAETEGL